VYKQLFKKKDRQLMATLRYGLTDDAQNNMNKTITNFYQGGAVDSIDVIDQMRVFDGASTTIGGKITYSEPLTKKFILVVDYGHNRNNSSSYRNTFNKSNNGKYESLDTVFSNNFDLDAFSHSGMTLLRYVDKKVKGVIGSGFSSVKLNLYNLDNKQRNSYNFLNYTPQAQIGYSPQAQTNVSFNYKGNTRQPNIEQLQPIRNNEDPLYEFQGNPELKVGFTHNLNFNFHQFKMLAQRYLHISTGYDLHQNAITNYTIIDTTLGKQIYRPVNVDGNRNWHLWSGWGRWRGQKKLSYGVNVNGNGGVNNTFVQQKDVVIKNRTDYNNINFGISLSYQEDEKRSFEFRPNIGNNTTKSSIQPDIKYNYFTYGGQINGFIMLPLKLELSTEVNLNYQQKLPNFPANQNFTIWNASLARKVFKKKTGKFIFDMNDILNQNRGFNRIINSSFVQEERYNRLARYFLLRFEWSFNKMPGGTATK
jgi:hypothetical protein